MHQGLVPRRVTILVFSRDVGLVVVGALLFATTGARDFRPSLWGKANTVAQIIAVASTLWAAFYPAPVLVLARRLSLIATFALTLISWFHYTWRETRRLGSEESRNSV
jgi:cardiolipin synthase